MDIGKINPFMMQQQPISATKAVGQQFGSQQVSGSQQANPFASTKASNNQNTVGINTNIGVGDTSYTAAQAGKPAAVNRTLAFA